MSLRPRALLGPACLGVAVWCAAGQVAVASVESASIRLVVPASWWWMPLGFVAGLALPRIRRDPRFALPALVATVPWWPVPLPPVALIWTGPLGWAPIVLAGLAALTLPRALSARLAASPRHMAWRAGAVTVALALAAAWSAQPWVPTGDEPHYLAITHSLIRDGDLRVENDYADATFRAAFGDLKPDFIRRGKNGEIYSIHSPGLSVLVLPGYGLANYVGAQLTIILLAGWTGGLVWLTAWRATDRQTAAWFAWAAVVLGTAFLFQSFTVFPDGPGAFVVAASVWLSVRLAEADERGEVVRLRSIAAVSAAIACLPWLHTRFAVLAAGFGAAITWQLLQASTRSSGDRLRRVGAFLGVPAISAVLWFAYFFVIYGTPNPAAPYGDTSGPGGTHLVYAPGGLVGLLFDGQFGALAYAPVLAVAVLGAGRLDRVGRAAGANGLVAVLYLLSACTYWMWWAGVPASPARLMTATLPVLAVPLARAWARANDATRGVFGVLLAVTAMISAIVFGVDRAELAWNVRGGETRWLSWLNPLVNLTRGWPSFFWRLDPGHPQSEIPFLVHVAVWVGLFVVGAAIVVRMARQRQWDAGESRVAAIWWLLVSLTTVVLAGWALTAARPLNPARAQLSVLAQTGQGQSLWLVRPGVARPAVPTGLIRIVADDLSIDSTDTWATWTNVPAGIYRLHVSLARPQTAQIRVVLAPNLAPLALDLQPLPEQSFVISVTGGSERLMVVPAPPWQMVRGRVALEPLTVGTPSGQ